MSKSKPRHVDQIYELKRQLKEKDDEIRKLYRKLHNRDKAEKKEHKKDKKLPKKVEVKEGCCPTCLKGKLSKSDLGFRVLETCNTCNYRKVIKKHG
jgi:predicted RNase H-like nuclease (RuvC/YqgF family)